MKSLHALANTQPDGPTLSARRLLSNYRLTPALSVRAALLSDLIGERYEADGRAAGQVGIPLGGVRLLSDGGAAQPYSGGYITVRDNKTDPIVTHQATVRLLGFRCNEESDFDELSDADEPYFIVGVTGINSTKTATFGPYENINKGDVQFTGEDGLLTTDVQPPFVISVQAMEHDEGDPAAAAAKVQGVCLEAIRVTQVAASVIRQPQVLVATVALQTIFAQVGTTLSGVAAAVLGLGDDSVGSGNVEIGSYNDGIEQWATPDRIVEPEPFSDSPYNVTINVGSRGEGNYTLYFNVAMFMVNRQFIPPLTG